MNARFARLILVSGVASLIGTIAFMIIFADIRVATSVEQHQSTRGGSLATAEPQATLRAVSDLATRSARGTQAPTTRAKATTVPTALPSPPAQGQPFLVNGTRYTVNEVRDPEPPGFFSPARNMRFIAVDITQEAVSTPSPYSIAYFNLRDGGGKDYGWANGNSKPTLGNGTLAAGESTRGWVIFQVPADAKITTLIGWPDHARPRVSIADLAR